MLASEVIERLQKLIKEHGDLEVYDFWVEEKLQCVEYTRHDMDGDIEGFDPEECFLIS